MTSGGANVILCSIFCTARTTTITRGNATGGRMKSSTTFWPKKPWSLSSWLCRWDTVALQPMGALEVQPARAVSGEPVVLLAARVEELAEAELETVSTSETSSKI